MPPRSRSRYAFANKKRHRSLSTSSSYRKFNRSNNGYRRIPRFGGTAPNALYAKMFPQSMKVAMTYTDFITITTSAGLSNSHIFNLNSIFDPDRTGVGHQPLGRDEWGFMYGKYLVDGALVEVRTGQTTTANCMWSLVGSIDITTSITDAVQASELPNSVTTQTSNAGQPVVLRKYFNMANLFGITRSKYNADDIYESVYTASPSNPCVCHLVVADSGLSNVAANAQVTITYYCTLKEPISLTRS